MTDQRNVGISEVAKVSIQHLEIMLHTLGLTDPERKDSYRNHFVAGDGHSDMGLIQDLMSEGLMAEDTPPRFLVQGDRVFYVTEQGQEYCMQHREKPPKLSKAKRRYQKFCDLYDCYPDLTFKEFLTHPHFEDTRRGI